MIHWDNRKKTVKRNIVVTTVKPKCLELLNNVFLVTQIRHFFQICHLTIISELLFVVSFQTYLHVRHVVNKTSPGNINYDILWRILIHRSLGQTKAAFFGSWKTTTTTTTTTTSTNWTSKGDIFNNILCARTFCTNRFLILFGVWHKVEHFIVVFSLE